MSLSAEEIQNHVEQQQRDVKEIKEILKKGSPLSAEAQEKLDKIDKSFEKHDETNQQIMKDKAISDKLIEDLKVRVHDFEKGLYRMPGGMSPSQGSETVKAFEDFLRKGAIHMDGANKQILVTHFKEYMRTDNAPAGGFLMPVQWYDDILKNITELSELRPFATVVQIGAKSLFVPLEEQLLSANATAEAQAYVESINKYGGVEITPKKITSKTPVTMEALEDSAYNLDMQITNAIQRAVLKEEGHQIVNGDGVNEIPGFMNNPGVESFNTGVADDITPEIILDLTGEIKRGYRPLFGFNRRTLVRIRKFEDGHGRFLWTPSGSTGLAAGMPNEIGGMPYIIIPDMPDIAADAYPIVYADFTNLMIVDRIGIMVSRDFFTESDNDKVVYRSRKRTGADITLLEGFKKLKVAV